ncbi:Dipeptidyl aminopeptidase/acylaminoacyl peptidase [Paenimyroides aquimaris]|uniref:Dipeptidyl aminopeptidase/acylaminoacyl peptidase n=1 Tax=Paenimyroides marinum TaxID=1159016 RepID=A0A1H6L6A2_9FLAO|nr:prolyl oligopeptidase family serine peptidase [Paenimyroides aquimaris]SEH83915.1 Dipeptidyl aminopeptidase/acylaminoacyl peptidase [Paenimyroides aquimaris]
MKRFKQTLLALLLATAPMIAQENITYQKPSHEILQLADYERAPSVSMSSNKEWMVLSYRNTYKSLDELNQDELRLGGLRINPNTNISSTASFINTIKIKKVSDQAETNVKGLPANALISNLIWAPNETMLAFTNTTATGNELWILDLKTATAKKLTDAVLNANLGNPITWYKNSDKLLIKVIPADRKALINAEKAIPTGPIVSTAEEGVISQNRTYQDLLKNKTDEANFETIVTSELYTIDLNGNKKLFKNADLYAGETFSPDGTYILLTTIQKPFSYLVPLNRFPMKTIAYTAEGTEVKLVNNVPLSEVMPKGFMAVRTGKRSMTWRADKPATLFFVEALDEGDPAKAVEFRDALYTWEAPFNNQPELLTKTPQRYGGILWGDDQTAIVYDQWYDTRNIKTYLFNPSKKSVLTTIWDRNYQDIYSDPGDFQTKKNEFGRYTLQKENNKLYLIGEGHTKEGQFPFIDEFDLESLKTKRLYQSDATDRMESITEIIDAKKGEILVNIQSKTDYPNYFFRNIKNKKGLKQITFNQNPFASIKNVHKEVIKYKRKDGVELSGTLYLPANYNRKNPTEKLPLLIWAYPAEYKDKNSAGQSSANPNEFTFPYYGSFVYWAAKGYAVLDDAAFPIIGEGTQEPNDTFIEQLVMNAEAAIDAVDQLGYIDRTRVGVGGHSYGAFMTANLLSHSNLFACGVARSGAYNRTLTPFGFQSEQRNYWEVPNVYNAMSPFMNAEKMKTPMLLVHGEADNNPGTFTLQTERYFQALKGLGAPVRMVILPKESHSYVAKENILHLLWEQEQFLDKYLKK